MTDKHIIRIVGSPLGECTKEDGRFLTRYDPDYGEHGVIETSSDRDGDGNADGRTTTKYRPAISFAYSVGGRDFKCCPREDVMPPQPNPAWGLTPGAANLA